MRYLSPVSAWPAGDILATLKKAHLKIYLYIGVRQPFSYTQTPALCLLLQLSGGDVKHQKCSKHSMHINGYTFFYVAETCPALDAVQQHNASPADSHRLQVTHRQETSTSYKPTSKEPNHRFNWKYCFFFCCWHVLIKARPRLLGVNTNSWQSNNHTWPLKSQDNSVNSIKIQIF